MFRKSTLLTLLLAVGGTAFAQRTTGTMSGTAKDASGAVLPGVSVTATGPNVVGGQTAVSNELGFYRIANLPPGEYKVSFTLSGFKTVNRTGVRVGLGQQVEEDVSLAVTALQEEVTVVAESAVVDTTSSEVGANYDRDWVENAPTKRLSFFDLVSAAPGSLAAGDGGGPHGDSTRTMVYGSSYDENAYQLDGVDITDNFFNEAQAAPNIDAIEEVEVLSLGAPAEYGNLQGAVYNIVTRQGTNEFHGDLNYFFQSAGLVGRNTKDAQDDGSPYTRDSYHDFTAQLGGPIVKDKLWFFGSYQIQRDKSAPTGLPASAFSALASSDRFMGKLTWQLHPKHKIVANFHLDDVAQDNYAISSPSQAGIEPITRRAKTPTPGVAYTGVLSDKAVLDVRYSGFYGDITGFPTDPSAPLSQPRFYNLDDASVSGGWYYWYQVDTKRNSATAKISYLADDFLNASHDFRFGVQYQDAVARGVYGYNDYITTYTSYGQVYGYGYDRQTFGYSGNSRGFGVFLDDTVRVNDRLTLNLGVRYDHNKAFAADQDELDELGNPTGGSFPQTDFYTWTNFSPRLGFNWKITGDGKTVLKGHYGRYHRSIATGEFANVIGPNVKPYFFGDFDAASGQLVNLVQITSNENLGVDPEYQAPYTDQFTVSLERELAKSLGVHLDYVHKRGRKGVAWSVFNAEVAPVTFVDSADAFGENANPGATGQTIQLQQLQNDFDDLRYEISNPDGMEANINAVTLGLLRRMTGNWQLNASATWLRSTGRNPDSSGAATLLQRGGLQFRSFGRDPNDFVNTDGRLRGDSEWQIKAQFLRKWPWDITTAVSFSRWSNAHLVRRAALGSLTNFTGTTLLQKRGENGRLPSVNLVDLRVQKDFKLSEKVRLAVFADVFNLLNDDSNQGVLSSTVTSSSFNLPATFVLPRRALVGAKFKF